MVSPGLCERQTACCGASTEVDGTIRSIAMIEELEITNISTSVGENGADQTTTLTVYVNPDKIVSAGIAILAFLTTFRFANGAISSAVATIRRVSIRDFGDLELHGLTPSVVWLGLESITFELRVTSPLAFSEAATIFIAQSSV